MTDSPENSTNASSMDLQGLFDSLFNSNRFIAESPCSSPQEIVSKVQPRKEPSPPEVHLKINYNESLSDRIGSLVHSGELTDVKFLIGEKKVEIQAHKLILALSSPVFTSMFFSPYESQNVIEIPDCQPEAFQAMIQCMYKGELNGPTMDVNLALSTLYTARKYAVKGLEDICTVTLSSSITPKNVFEVLEAADYFTLSTLESECWQFIQEKPGDVIRAHMEHLDQETLITILKNDKLSIKEVDLFEVLMEWAEIKCKDENLSPTPENKVSVCGLALNHIRFPVMKSSEFANKVVPSGVLTVEKVAKILTYISSSPDQQNKLTLEYLTNRREPKLELLRSNVYSRANNVPTYLTYENEDGNETRMFVVLEATEAEEEARLALISPPASNRAARRSSRRSARRRNQ